jgi:hypothetical protein
LQAAEQGAEAGLEALIAIRVPGMSAMSGQGGEAVRGQGAEEGVQLLSRRGVPEPPLGR